MQSPSRQMFFSCGDSSSVSCASSKLRPGRLDIRNEYKETLFAQVRSTEKEKRTLRLLRRLSVQGTIATVRNEPLTEKQQIQNWYTGQAEFCDTMTNSGEAPSRSACFRYPFSLRFGSLLLFTKTISWDVTLAHNFFCRSYPWHLQFLYTEQPKGANSEISIVSTITGLFPSTTCTRHAI